MPPPVATWDTVGAFPDLYGDEAAREALQAAQDAYRPTEAELADPDQEWVDVRGFGDAGPYYIRGRS